MTHNLIRVIINLQSFCNTAILFLEKIAVAKFSNEPGSAPLLAWERANWVQETCLLIQSTVLRAASLYFTGDSENVPHSSRRLMVQDLLHRRR